MASNDNMTDDGNAAFVSPRSLPYLADNGLAHDLVDALRWGGKPHCPRCTSTYTKRVNTHVFRQLYRCVDCGYMFNSLSGTIFHGSKLPIHKYFHLFIARNALGGQMTTRDVCFALDVSHKTASILLKRTEDILAPFQFAVADRKLSAAAAPQSEQAEQGENEAFFSYCEMKSIVVNEQRFLDYVRFVSDEEVNGFAHGRAQGGQGVGEAPE